MGAICALFQKYEQDARESFDLAFVNSNHIMSLAEAVQLCDENKKMLRTFLNDADESVLFFLWRFYHLQFCTNEDFSDNIWQLDEIPLPEEVEHMHPGCIKAAVYLLAAEHLRAWCDARGLPKRMVEDYFDVYRGYVNSNLIDPETYGLCRLSPFLYGYAKPFIVRVGRLDYQLTRYKDYCEMYENNRGDHLFAALPNYRYDDDGLQDEVGAKPEYYKNGDKLTARTFDKSGRLRPRPEEIDLTHWRLVLKPGDPVWTIHIPGGRKLDPCEVSQSLSDAARFFDCYFPPYKTFVCHTWFIDPGLRDEVVRNDSNMAAFANLFNVISGPDNHNHSVFAHVFRVKKQSLENLIPQNTFQARVLRHVLAGKKIYWSYGVLKKEVAETVRNAVNSPPTPRGGC